MHSAKMNEGANPLEIKSFKHGAMIVRAQTL